ncbi:hypothetical protein T4E_4381 [Trichinella pseudospiralis]|uniref:Uncharacterized protein n=1 Tax=Trichinella pseudospiralis TaxID=6337 RepID=A0A0V0XSW3_TRIPS|nr:hypothetical protein T4E_4381 [Trichinella pseudospiralis]
MANVCIGQCLSCDIFSCTCLLGISPGRIECQQLGRQTQDTVFTQYVDQLLDSKHNTLSTSAS